MSSVLLANAVSDRAYVCEVNVDSMYAGTSELGKNFIPNRNKRFRVHSGYLADRAYTIPTRERKDTH